MYIYIYIYMYIVIYIYTHMCMYIFEYIYIFTCTYIYTYILVYFYMFIHIYICICISCYSCIFSSLLRRRRMQHVCRWSHLLFEMAACNEDPTRLDMCVCGSPTSLPRSYICTQRRSKRKIQRVRQCVRERDRERNVVQATARRERGRAKGTILHYTTAYCIWSVISSFSNLIAFGVSFLHSQISFDDLVLQISFSTLR